jgi:hypothetical protein
MAKEKKIKKTLIYAATAAGVVGLVTGIGYLFKKHGEAYGPYMRTLFRRSKAENSPVDNPPKDSK